MMAQARQWVAEQLAVDPTTKLRNFRELVPEELSWLGQGNTLAHLVREAKRKLQGIVADDEWTAWSRLKRAHYDSIHKWIDEQLAADPQARSHRLWCTRPPEMQRYSASHFDYFVRKGRSRLLT